MSDVAPTLLNYTNLFRFEFELHKLCVPCSCVRDLLPWQCEAMFGFSGKTIGLLKMISRQNRKWTRHAIARDCL